MTLVEVFRGQVRPAIRHMAAAFLVLLVPLLAFQAWDFFEMRRLVAEVQRIEAAGGTLEERRAPGTRPFAAPGPESAGQHYLAAGLLALGSDVAAVMRPVREWQANPQGPTASVAAMLGPLRVLVAQSAPALQLVDRASALPYTGLPAGTEFSYRTASLQTVSSLLAARAVERAADGDGDAAAATMLTMLRVRVPLLDVHWLRGAPLPIGALLSLSRPSDARLEELEAALGAADSPGRTRENYARERARMFERWSTFHGITVTSSGMTPPAGPVWPLRPLIAHRTYAALRRWTELEPLLDAPWPRVLATLQAMPAAQPSMGEWADDAFRAVAEDPSLALDRCARVAVALARHARAHDGVLPGALSELVPRFLPAVPADPFGAGALAYVHDGARFTVYSRGADGRDDGGRLTGRSAVGQRGRPGEPGTDLGVRVALDLALEPRPSAARAGHGDPPSQARSSDGPGRAVAVQ